MENNVPKPAVKRPLGLLQPQATSNITHTLHNGKILKILQCNNTPLKIISVGKSFSTLQTSSSLTQPKTSHLICQGNVKVLPCSDFVTSANSTSALSKTTGKPLKPSGYLRYLSQPSTKNEAPLPVHSKATFTEAQTLIDRKNVKVVHFSNFVTSTNSTLHLRKQPNVCQKIHLVLFHSHCQRSSSLTTVRPLLAGLQPKATFAEIPSPAVHEQPVVEEVVSGNFHGVHHDSNVLVVKQSLPETPHFVDNDLLEARARAAAVTNNEVNITPVFVECNNEDSDEDYVDVASDSDAESAISSDDDSVSPSEFSNHDDDDDPTDLSEDDFVPKKKVSTVKYKTKTKSNSKELAIIESKSNLNDVNEKLMKIIFQADYLYSIVSVEDCGGKYNHLKSTFRINISTKTEVQNWLRGFEKESKTNFRVWKTRDFSKSKRVTFKFQKIYRCHHNTLAEKSGSKTPHEKHIKCPAYMTITIKNQNMIWSKDHLLKKYPCEVTIKHIHNHETVKASGDLLRHRRPSSQVKEFYTNLFTDFKSRVSPAQAMHIHLSNLGKEDPDRMNIGDGALCPEMSWVYKLYNKITKDKCGQPYGPEIISALEKSVEEYNASCKDVCAKLGSTSDGKSHFVVICSPMMKRVLTHHKAAAEIMFIDSSGNMDNNNNARVFVMVAPSPVCGLPEGLLITFSETEAVVTAALKLWLEIIPPNAFC
ncbi:Proline--tRNA ligase [Frankliniella fusca]|uniref:Proline--tRNA ligase n=1 Tax=Frankliniella fusca TaxID=407009 RepID=A0AAE1HP18_9NEOP|nr:Proline--tRNA ligase [Frankliniella fusca]